MPLRDALAVSMDITGRTGEQACKHAIILMAQSLASPKSGLTKASKKNRKVIRDPEQHRAEYVNVWHKGKESRFYRWSLEPGGGSTGTWEQAKQIAGRGLARRSWIWGLRGLGKTALGSRPIGGVTNTRAILGKKASGYVLTNRLSYILKAMTPGWSQAVVRLAGNKIMAQAKKKLEGKWKRNMAKTTRGRKRPAGGIDKHFKRV